MKKTYFTISALFCISLMIFSSSLIAQLPENNSQGPLVGKWYTEKTDVKSLPSAGLNPLITNYISQINADSIKGILQSLQNMGTRFLLAPNHKEVAQWIADRFKFYGYSDTEVKLDSFYLYVNNLGFQDSTWQYNVVCTLKGASAPDEQYVIGGHYDSFCWEHSMTVAPGVNDNGTAVAATLEIARIIKKENFHPEATIKFSLFAAEELGLYGSWDLAEKARNNGDDIRFVLNMDMISNNPENIQAIKIYRYRYCPWAGDLTADCFQRYTTLDAFVPQADIPSSTDSYCYWAHAFPTTSLEEIVFSPYWHQLSDTVGNCNIEYCAEVTRGAFATLLEQQFIPYTDWLSALSTKDGITLSWNPTKNERVKGFNLYRSENISHGFIRINTTGLIPDTSYTDLSVDPGVNYYYKVRCVNDSLEEGFPSEVRWGARFAFSDSLLVVANLSGTAVTPDSIRQFYHAALDTVPYKWFDQNSLNPLDLATLSRYQNVMFITNSTTFDSADDTLANNLYNFFGNGGNLLYCGFLPSKYFDQNTTYPLKTYEYSLMKYFFKTDSVDRKVPCMMYRANPVTINDYDTLRIDPEKYTQATYPGEIHNLEVFAADSASKAILTLDSHFSVTSPMGAMKGKAVGIEYMGDDYKTILLSFPLYYLDTADARKFLKFVMKEKFSHPTGINDPAFDSGRGKLINYPNPCSDHTKISFELQEPADVTLLVYDVRGVVVAKILERKLDSGIHTVQYSVNDLPSGIYQLVLKTPGETRIQKMVVLSW